MSRNPPPPSAEPSRSGRRRTQWPMRRVHKWITIVIGVFFAMWIATGIVMSFPPSVAGPRGSAATAALDYAKATITPAAAVAALKSSEAPPLKVVGLTLRQIGDATVYRIELSGAPPALIDAGSGRRVPINESLAREIARTGFPPDATIERVELLEQHTLAYRFGPLPVYRVSLGDARRTIASVSAHDGGVQYTDRRSALRRAFTGMHDFTILRIAVSPRIVRWLLVLASVVGAGAVVTGYYLALPNRRQRQQA
ncbi:MAG: PepSY domain-containing protein [Gemmatimonadaceae bacterium]